jgi:hypothetical protein
LDRVKVFEIQHRAGFSLDASVVLLNDIVEVFALADCNTFVLVSIQLFQARLIRTALIHIHQTRFAIFLDGFF